MGRTILWVYIALLLVGGLMGYLKAGSKVSLITSVLFAGLLAIFAAGMVSWTVGADVLLGILLLVFVMRYVKTKKFMPPGFLIAVTAVTLVLRFLVRGD